MSPRSILDALAPMAEAADSAAAQLLATASRALRVTAEAHPLGMVAIRFDVPDFTVRVHVWTVQTQAFRDEFGQIHDHIWDLESHVLLGEIENAVFDLHESSAGERLWRHNYDTHEIVETDERFVPVLRSRQAFPAASAYTLPAGRMHTTPSTANGSITLVKATPTALRTARILGASHRATRRTAQRHALSPQEALEHVRMAVQCHGQDS